MITLITGAPGSGKTLFCVDKIIGPTIGTRVAGVDENGQPAVYQRVVYTNINGLLLEHEMVDAAWLEGLADNKKPGAVVVYDEVQRVWPNRPTGSKKPAAVEYLETHRHDGIDVVLLTQSPQLLDPAVRALVGRHLHMRRVGSFGAAIVYEWDACSNGLNFKQAFSKTPYRYSGKAAAQYKSARVHTKQKRRLPFALWLGLAGLLGALVMWPQLASRLKAHSSPQSIEKTADKGLLASAGDGVKAGVSKAAAAGKPPPMTRAEYVASLRPRYLGLPHTAERYDQLTQPTRVPYPAACMVSKKQGCKCYSQDATPMYVPDQTCRDIVAGGLFLDFEPDRLAQVRAQTAPITERTVYWKTNTGAPLVGAGGMGVQTPHVTASSQSTPQTAAPDFKTAQEQRSNLYAKGQSNTMYSPVNSGASNPVADKIGAP